MVCGSGAAVLNHVAIAFACLGIALIAFGLGAAFLEMVLVVIFKRPFDEMDERFTGWFFVGSLGGTLCLIVAIAAAVVS